MVRDVRDSDWILTAALAMTALEALETNGSSIEAMAKRFNELKEQARRDIKLH